MEARQRLDSQKSENDGVLKVRSCPFPPPPRSVRLTFLFVPTLVMVQEFSLLKSHNQVYKLIGPGLVKQDQAEARSNVEKRLEFINSEM